MTTRASTLANSSQRHSGQDERTVGAHPGKRASGPGYDSAFGSRKRLKYENFLTHQMTKTPAMLGFSVEAPGIERRPLADSQRNLEQSGAASENGETKICRIDGDHAAEFAARQTPAGVAERIDEDADDLATALWRQAARSSIDAVAFGFGGEL